MKKVWLGLTSLAFLSFVIFIWFYVALSVVSESISLGNGFEYMNSGRDDNHHIKKNDDIVVENAVVDISQAGDFVAGIQLPRCSNTHEQKILLSSKTAYFILNIQDESLAEYSSKADFESALKRLNIFTQITLDYERLARLRAKLSKGYSSSASNKDKLDQCNNVEYQHLTIE